MSAVWGRQAQGKLSGDPSQHRCCRLPGKERTNEHRKWDIAELPPGLSAAAAALPTLAKPGGPSIIEGLGDIAKLDQTTDFATGETQGSKNGFCVLWIEPGQDACVPRKACALLRCHISTQLCAFSIDGPYGEAAVLAVGYVIGGASNFTFYNPNTMQTIVQTGEWLGGLSPSTFPSFKINPHLLLVCLHQNACLSWQAAPVETTAAGKFKSWQCADANGTFNAIVELTTLTNGTREHSRSGRCAGHPAQAALATMAVTAAGRLLSGV